MRLRLARMRLVLTYVGSILFVFGLVLLAPLLFALLQSGGMGLDVRPGTFTIPIAVSLLLGAACRWQMRRMGSKRRIGTTEAMLICVLSWIVVSAVGALPFSHELGQSHGVTYLDAYFEAMSGFTTTGITMLNGLDGMPKSLLFWRSLTQWIGGLGILSFFMFVVFQGGLSHRLFGAESHKIGGRRIAPGMWHTLNVLWLVYVFFTVVVAGGLCLLGLSLYDAISHAFTCLSTGGYSPHDASIGYYAAHAGQYPHYKAIEYLLIFGMWAGGTNFLIHYRLMRGDVRCLWDGDEIRAWWLVLAGATLLVMGAGVFSPTEEAFRRSLFQVVSIGTTTGYTTADIGNRMVFSPFARQVFLVLMLIGGCAGSTGGGLKIVRIVILWKLLAQQVRRALRPPSSVDLILLDGRRLPPQEVYRTSALLSGWLAMLLFGAAVTAGLSEHGTVESASGMFSALGNIGPCYIPVEKMSELSPVIKLIYIAGMLAGRLEIVPLLILFSGRAWK